MILFVKLILKRLLVDLVNKVNGVLYMGVSLGAQYGGMNLHMKRRVFCTARGTKSVLD